jgi:hypothetical protein
LAGSLPIAPAAGRRRHANIGGLHPRVAGPIERAVVVFITAGLQSLSFLLVGVSASAAVQRYVFGHATAEFVYVTFFVVLGALFTATTQTIVPRRDLTTLSGTWVASVLTLMPVATLLSISSGVGRPGSGGARAWRARSCMTTPSNDASSRCSGTPSSTLWPMRAPSCCSSSLRTTNPSR